MKQAFKEWAVVCRALASGRQILILRKGGIEEEGGAFQLCNRQFLLFPTGYHQAPESVKPSARALLDGAEGQGVDEGKVTVSHFAVVSGAFHVASLETLHAIRDEHIWSDAAMEERYNRWCPDSMYAMIVRVHALAEPVIVPLLDSYRGCRSWVALEVDVPTDGAAPVLALREFETRAGRLKRLIKESRSKPAPGC